MTATALVRYHDAPTETVTVTGADLRPDDFVWQSPVSASFRVEAVQQVGSTMIVDTVPSMLDDRPRRWVSASDTLRVVRRVAGAV